MAETPRRGRPSVVDFCLDCHREGLVPPEAGPKQYGSYCKNHAYQRQRTSQIAKRTRLSSRKAVVLGHWDELPDAARGRLQDMAKERIKHVYEEYTNRAMAATVAFEYSCMERAISKGEKLTPQEEDRIIMAFGGSRYGVDAFSQVAGPPGTETTVEGPPLLPNPDVRRRHRAEQLGGPTTTGEPSFGAYYEAQYGKEPPVELREGEGAPDPHEMVRASNGMMIERQYLEEAERDLTALHVASTSTFPKFGDQPFRGADGNEHPEYTASLSELMRPHETE